MKIGTRFRTYFLAGILVTAPIGITLLLAWQVVGVIDGSISPLVPTQWNPDTYVSFHIPGFGILFVLVFLILIGYFVTGMIGQAVVKGSEWLLTHIPIIRSVYGWTRQIFETLMNEDSTAFREVVLVEYPYRGSCAIGFITGATEGEIQSLNEETVFNVFVPATPNPTTGFLLFLPESDLYHLDIAVDDGIKLVISGGMVKPPGEDDEAEDAAMAEELARIRAEVEAEREAAKHSAWGAGTGIAAEVDRIKAALEGEGDTYKRVTFLGALRNYLFTGLLVSAPIAITVWLCAKIIGYFDGIVLPLLPDAINPAAHFPFGFPGLGLIVSIATLTLIGFLTAGFLGEAIIRSGERLIQNLPFLRGVYSAVKQIFETLLKDQSQAFREVVLVQYPRPGSWAIGFITGDATKEIQGQAEGGEAVNIFLPTTPNPTSGFLIFLPRSETKPLSMSVEEGLKMVVSGGIVAPEPPESEPEGPQEPKGTLTSASETAEQKA